MAKTAKRNAPGTETYTFDEINLLSIVFITEGQPKFKEFTTSNFVKEDDWRKMLSVE